MARNPGTVVDLSGAEIIDNHLHGFRIEDLLAQDPRDFETRLNLLGTLFSDSTLTREAGREDPSLWRQARRMTESTVYSLAARRWLAERLGCEATAEGVAAAREKAFRADPVGYIRALLDDAGVAGLLVDDGFPLPRVPSEEFRAAVGGTPVHRVARIETMIVDARDEAKDLAALEDAFEAEMDRAAGDPTTVAFKSIIAYRTGLDVQPVTSREAAAAYERWRADGWKESRDHAKPVRDFLLYRAAEAARRNDRPLHVHTGNGDPDIVLSRARPHDLLPFLKEHLAQPIVLIHTGFPWTDVAAYIASSLPNVYLDLSVLIPWASLGIEQLLTVLLGTAPAGKLLYASDEASEPEVIWIAARMARRAMERALGDAVERDFITVREAEELGRGILSGNSRRLHGIEG
ncbi:MAG: amidohydrolase family protein [Actinobacteria bacterium]|nr:amidohydrolase family protein [Actinomycetota bacterium]